MFLNITNHPITGWTEEQIEEAKKIGGEVKEFGFPTLAPTMSTDDIIRVAKEVSRDIPGDVTHALVQGEMTLTAYLVKILQARGIYCYAACTDRVVEVKKNEDGSDTKISLFKFVQYREYPDMNYPMSLEK